MEMVSASPCITAMICFSMEVKFGNLFDTVQHMQRHRIGARGNATSFLLPWETVLSELQRIEGEESGGAGDVPDLPRTGSELAHVVHVLLKANDENQREDLAKFIFQAEVRRERVVRLILAMKQRGHRSYVRLSDATIRAKAMKLPEKGVPPELLALLPTDNMQDCLSPLPS